MKTALLLSMNTATADYLFEDMPEASPAPQLSPIQEFRRYVELTKQHKALLTQSQVALFLGVSNQRVEQWVRGSRLPVIGVAGGRFIPADALEEFMKVGRMKPGRPSKVSIALAGLKIG